MEPFSSHYISKIYKINRNGHNDYVCQLIFEDGKRQIMTYLRYCMATHLGRKLERGEYVYPINGDFTNGEPDNLQLCDWKEYTRNVGVDDKRRDNKKYFGMSTVCAYDGERFILSPEKQRARAQRLEKNPNAAGPFRNARNAALYRHNGPLNKDTNDSTTTEPISQP